MNEQTQVLENLQDIKELADKIINNTHYDISELVKLANEIYIKSHNSIELIYNTKNIQLIKPKYEFSPPKA
jgi:ABC-type proline/glycine betaine transport system ATPase subunit